MMELEIHSLLDELTTNKSTEKVYVLHMDDTDVWGQVLSAIQNKISKY